MQGCDKPVELDFFDEAFVRALGRARDISEPRVHAPEALTRSQQHERHTWCDGAQCVRPGVWQPHAHPIASVDI